MIEIRIINLNFIDFNLNIIGYNFEYVLMFFFVGGVGMYIDLDFKYEVFEKIFNEVF